MKGLRLAAMVLATLVILALAAPTAALIRRPGERGAPRVPVKTSDVLEVTPAAEDTWLAWAQNSRRHPRHFDMYAQDGANPRFRVNPVGTVAFGGGIDGAELIYQRIRRGNSDLKLFDLATQTHLPLPAGVNTNLWEWGPTNDANHLLFGRDDYRPLRDILKIVLFDTMAGNGQAIAQLRSRTAVLLPGQVNGDFAVYTRCTRAGGCNAFRYDITPGTTTMVPNPGSKQQYAASVGDDGTVYFARSGPACGANVVLMRYPVGGPADVLKDLGRNRDAFGTYTESPPAAQNDVFYEHVNCRAIDVDIHSEVDPAS